jgi:L-serine dehydratase
MYQSLSEICKTAKKNEIPFWQVVLEDDCRERGTTKQETFEKMQHMYEVMCQSDAEYEEARTSISGLVGKQGKKIEDYRTGQETICGDFMNRVIERAIKMGESNACMKRIVAAPTAGACGVVPAVLISMQNKFQISKETMTEALFVAAGIGGVIAARASISGAAGGCQAEIGSASSMAAGAAVYLRGGSHEQICDAAAIAMKNLLGLVCDPVAGLVEVPCVKRNVIGAVNALSCADLALAGVKSRIPADEVFDAMKKVGNVIAAELKETGLGGLAATPTGSQISKKMSNL